MGVTLAPEDIWQCLETLYVVTTGEVLRSSRGWMPTGHTTACTTKHYSAQNVNGAEAEKLIRVIHTHCGKLGGKKINKNIYKNIKYK